MDDETILREANRIRSEQAKKRRQEDKLRRERREEQRIAAIRRHEEQERQRKLREIQERREMAEIMCGEGGITPKRLEIFETLLETIHTLKIKIDSQEQKINEMDDQLYDRGC